LTPSGAAVGDRYLRRADQ